MGFNKHILVLLNVFTVKEKNLEQIKHRKLL